jgi:hypothetical protein
MKEVNMKSVVIAASVALAWMATAPARAWAQDAESRKLTYLTFSSPIQLPGLELPAGKYRFSIADPDESRRVIEVADEKGMTTYGLFLTIPDQRLKPSDNPVVLFNETPSGTPAAVKAWFYPGETTGYEMVYPRNQAIKIAKATHEHVLASDSESDVKGGDRVKAVHGAKVGRVDENGNVSSDR